MNSNFFNVAYLYEKIYQLFTGAFLPDSHSSLDIFLAFLSFIKPFSILASLLFLTGIIYCLIRMRAIVHESVEALHPHGHDEHGHGHEGEAHGDSGHGGASHHESAHETNPRWEKILTHINSTNQSDWRLAILECDIILDEMLTKMSYRGETLSDKLKAVEKSDFLTIDKAWEAHRVRNAVAHQGSNFQITDREAKRVIGLYEEVFREFHYI